MGTRRTNRRKAKLKAETIRQLDLKPVAPEDLDQVAGGGYKKSCNDCTNTAW